MLSVHSTEASTLVSKQDGGGNKSRKTTYQAPRRSDYRPGGQNRTSNRDGQWCTFCRKPRHTRETCFKLHGKEVVLSRIGGFKSMGQHQGYLSNKDPEEEVVKKDI